MKNNQSDGVIINLTPTGMIPTKEMTPYVPLTPTEIIKDILKCAKIGVNVVHIHIRDKKGEPTYFKEMYQTIILKVREGRPDLILGVSCSGRNYPEFEKRSDVLDLKGKSKPDLASLTLSSLNFNKVASLNSPDMIIKLAEKMKKNKIKPELEVFDIGMVNYAKYLIKKGILEPPYYFNVILGNIACAQAKPSHLGMILDELPKDSIVTLGGIGNYQQDINLCGLIFADGVRIGLEDNIYYDRDRKTLAKNSMLVKRIIEQTKLLNKNVMNPMVLRRKLKLRTKI